MELEKLRIVMLCEHKSSIGISRTNTRKLSMTKGSQERTEMADTNNKVFVKRWF